MLPSLASTHQEAAPEDMQGLRVCGAGSTVTLQPQRLPGGAVTVGRGTALGTGRLGCRDKSSLLLLSWAGPATQSLGPCKKSLIILVLGQRGRDQVLGPSGHCAEGLLDLS